MGEPLIATGLTVWMGGAEPIPARAHGLAGAVSVRASGKLYVLPRPSEEPMYQGSRATFCRWFQIRGTAMYSVGWISGSKLAAVFGLRA